MHLRGSGEGIRSQKRCREPSGDGGQPVSQRCFARLLLLLLFQQHSDRLGKNGTGVGGGQGGTGAALPHLQSLGGWGMGGGTRHVSIFCSFCSFVPPLMINLPSCSVTYLQGLSCSYNLFVHLKHPHTHTTNSLISHSQPPSRLRSHTCTHQPTQKALSHASRGLNGLFSRMISTLVEAACPQKSRVK